jgi:hypothetical protein
MPSTSETMAAAVTKGVLNRGNGHCRVYRLDTAAMDVHNMSRDDMSSDDISAPSPLAGLSLISISLAAADGDI